MKISAQVARYRAYAIASIRQCLDDRWDVDPDEVRLLLLEHDRLRGEVAGSRGREILTT